MTTIARTIFQNAKDIGTAKIVSEIMKSKQVIDTDGTVIYTFQDDSRLVFHVNGFYVAGWS